jgi:hypothetical protein
MMRSLVGQAALPSDHANSDGARLQQPATTLAWRSSTASEGADHCVQVARIAQQVWVRDSKDPDGPVLKLRREGWVTFIDGLRYATLGSPTLTILVIISGSVAVRERRTVRRRVTVRKWARSLRSPDGAHQRWGRKRSTLLFPRSAAVRLAS